jgi:hypothetical protein
VGRFSELGVRVERGRSWWVRRRGFWSVGAPGVSKPYSILHLGQGHTAVRSRCEPRTGRVGLGSRWRS